MVPGVGSTFQWCQGSLRGRRDFSSPLFFGVGENDVDVFLNVQSTMQSEPLELVSSPKDPDRLVYKEYGEMENPGFSL